MIKLPLKREKEISKRKYVQRKETKEGRKKYVINEIKKNQLVTKKQRNEERKKKKNKRREANNE